MNKKMLQETFRKWKKVSGAQFAITNPDGLGDCQSCVWDALCDKYGVESKGMFVKHWTRGMNGDYPIDSERIDYVYLAHDIDEEMAKTVYEVFGENYNVLPAEYDPHKCFCLYEKGTPVWQVSWVNEVGRVYTEEFTNEMQAVKYLNNRFDVKSWDTQPTLKRLF